MVKTRFKTKKKSLQADFEQAILGKRPTLTLGIKKKSVVQIDENKNFGLIVSLGNKNDLPEVKLEDIKPNFPLKRRQKFKPIISNGNESALLSKHLSTEPKSTPIIKIPRTKGKLEINIKIEQLPNWVETVKNGWKQLYLNVEGNIVRIKVRPKTWVRLLAADKDYEKWIASINGKMGQRIKNGFELIEPAIQIYQQQMDDE
ncbi:MAG: hypothetical protein KAH84_05120 [Thiomargarita sp.]|nr:hypothetical protein [Bacteroidales bacterium]MCK5719317.1 hypothetical protein [Thiomargarita sp.]